MSERDRLFDLLEYSLSDRYAVKLVDRANDKVVVREPVRILFGGPKDNIDLTIECGLTVKHNDYPEDIYSFGIVILIEILDGVDICKLIYGDGVISKNEWIFKKWITKDFGGDDILEAVNNILSKFSQKHFNNIKKEIVN